MEIKASIPGWPDYMITNLATVLSYKGKDRAERVLKVTTGASRCDAAGAPTPARCAR